MTELPRKLREWLKQPGAILPPKEDAFIFALDAWAQMGVGYGFMQQIAEWLWQEKCERDGQPGGAWGPESHAAEMKGLKAQRDRLLDCCRTAVGAYEAIKLVGTDGLLPGYERCLADLKAVIAESTPVGRPVTAEDAVRDFVERRYPR